MTSIGRARESWKAKAARHGVSTRTLDRWVKDGIIAPPEKINNRKYGDATEEPRHDGEKAA
jgi:DNA-binding transcriptional MerR regulator